MYLLITTVNINQSTSEQHFQSFILERAVRTLEFAAGVGLLTTALINIMADLTQLHFPTLSQNPLIP